MQVDGFDIRHIDVDGVCLIELSGELDMATAPDVREALDGCDDFQRGVVGHEPSGVVDSHGLIALVEGRDRFGPRFELLSGKAVDRLVTLTGLPGFFWLDRTFR